MKTTTSLTSASGSRTRLHPLLFLGCLFGVFLLMQSCVRESMGDCTTYEGTLRILLPDGNDITSDSTVGTIGVYQFESDGFVRQVPWEKDTVVAIGVETAKSLALVAWGNLQPDTLQVLPPSVGDSPESARVSLRKKADGYQFPAPDLFYGRYEKGVETTRHSPSGSGEVQPDVAPTRGAQTQAFSLVMERKVSALSVRIFHPAEHFGGTSGNLRLLVRGTCASLNFRGEPMDGTAVYAPSLQAVAGADEWSTSLFRIFPTPANGGMSLELYHNDELVLTVTVDDEGNLLQAVPGKEIYVTVDFRYSRLYVGVEVKPWGSTEQEVTL
jgi:hypothetical protein